MRNDKYNVVRISDGVVVMRNKSRYQVIIEYCLPKGRFNKFIGTEFEFQGDKYVIETNKTPENILHGKHNTSQEQKLNNALKMLDFYGNTCLSMQSEEVLEKVKQLRNVKVTKYYDDKISDRMLCTSARGKYRDYHYLIEEITWTITLLNT